MKYFIKAKKPKNRIKGFAGPVEPEIRHIVAVEENTSNLANDREDAVGEEKVKPPVHASSKKKHA